MRQLLQELLSQATRSGGSEDGLAGLLGLSGLPMIDIVVAPGEPTVLYQTDKTVCTVRDGVCQQEKTVAGFVGIDAQGYFCCGIMIYADETSDEPEATWQVCPRKNKVLSALRTIDLILNHRTVITHDSIEDTYIAVVGGPNRGEIRDEVGEETFDAILTEGPDGLDIILTQLAERGIPFDKQEVTDAMRNGGVEPSDELTALGIETPQQWDERVAREKAMQSRLGPHFQKLLRTIVSHSCDAGLQTLNGFALRAAKKGVQDDATLVGVAGVLYVITGGGNAKIDDLTTDTIGQSLGRYRNDIAKLAKFLSVRFRSTQKSADTFQAEVCKIVSEWDMTEDTEPTANAVSVPADVTA